VSILGEQGELDLVEQGGERCVMTSSLRNYIRRKGQGRQQRLIWALGLSTLLLILIISSVASIGRRSSEQRNAGSLGQLVVSEHGTPPNAEPNGRSWGPSDTPIQVIEYVDYECESCGYFARTYEADVVEAFAATGKVRFEIRNAPFHGEGSRNAAAAAYCAAEQNAFWPMHDSLFLNQPTTHGAGARPSARRARTRSPGSSALIRAPSVNAWGRGSTRPRSRLTTPRPVARG